MSDILLDCVSDTWTYSPMVEALVLGTSQSRFESEWVYAGGKIRGLVIRAWTCVGWGFELRTLGDRWYRRDRKPHDGAVMDTGSTPVISTVQPSNASYSLLHN
jgi:hypothetical protein